MEYYLGTGLNLGALAQCRGTSMNVAIKLSQCTKLIEGNGAYTGQSI